MKFNNDRKLPRDYVARKFFELGYRSHYNRGNDTYNCCCPICKEGKSWGRKKRCWYIPAQDLIYCFNCGWSSRPLRWIEEVGGISYWDIMREVEGGEYNFINLDKLKQYDEEAIVPVNYNEGLPEDAINLFNPLQLEYYRNNSIVLKALYYLKNRRLFSAVNKPKAFYLSLNDSTHRNRLIIPFFDIDGSIPFYQSRAIGGNIDGYFEDVRYLSKKNAGRTVFGIDRVDNELPYIFLFEGPIDACFIKNGVGIAGINLSKGRDLTQEQEEQLSRYRFTHQFIWMLDSQHIDSTAREKTEILLKENESVFIWPKELGLQYKDLNEYCVASKVDELPTDYILKNTVTGIEGMLTYKLKQING